MDDEGVELGSGVMELTQSELVLHLHQRDAVRWPYLCLRRYGYDSNLFSFESGRRCQTGQGEYQSALQDRDVSLLQNWSVALHILTSDIRLGDVAQSRERSGIAAVLPRALWEHLVCIHEVAIAPRPEPT